MTSTHILEDEWEDQTTSTLCSYSSDFLWGPVTCNKHCNLCESSVKWNKAIFS